MEDIGSWIYVIAIIGAVLSSLFKKKAAPKPPIDYEEEAEVETPSWDSFPSSGHSDSKYQPIPSPSRLERPGFTPVQSVSSRTPVPSTDIDSSIDLEEADEPIDIRFDTAADLKRALISAEVLNRKY